MNDRADFTAEDLALVGDDAIAAGDGQQDVEKAATPPAEQKQPQPKVPTLNEIDAQLAEIDAKRRADRSAYYRDERIQRLERDLLATRGSIVAAAQDDETLKAVTDDILSEIPQSERDDFGRAIDSLPGETHDMMRSFLTDVPLEPARPAASADVQRFETSDIGKELTAEWGDRAGYKLAKVRYQIESMLAARPREMGQTLKWFDGLPKGQAKAILRRLAK